MLEFDPHDHRYFYDGEEFISATTLVKSYSRPFDAQRHAARVAKREGVSEAAVHAKWAEGRGRASEKGNRVHDTVEGWVNQWRENDYLLMDGPAQTPEHVAAFSFLSHHPELMYGLMEAEFRCCHPDYGVAGTVDLVAGNFEGVPTLIDWKTSKTIEIVGYNRLYAPLHHLEDSNYWIYCLQLSLYARILRDCYHFDAQKLVMVHLKHDACYEIYEMIEKEEEVDKILKKGPKKPRKSRKAS